MFNIEEAFNAILRLQSRPMNIHDIENAIEITVGMAPSNYFRNLATFEETVTEGREFVVSKRLLDAQSFSAPERGMRIKDTINGFSGSISEVREMFHAGKIIGYRMRID